MKMVSASAAISGLRPRVEKPECEIRSRKNHTRGPMVMGIERLKHNLTSGKVRSQIRLGLPKSNLVSYSAIFSELKSKGGLACSKVQWRPIRGLCTLFQSCTSNRLAFSFWRKNCSIVMGLSSYKRVKVRYRTRIK